MGYAFVFRSNSLAGAAVPLCIGSTHGRVGLGPICPRRDETQREHSLELLSRLGVEQFGTKHYRAISAWLECLTLRKSRWANCALPRASILPEPDRKVNPNPWG